MEQWRAVVGFEGRYEVSDMGNVRSLRRGGSNSRLEVPRPLKQQESGPRGRAKLAKTVMLYDGERQRFRQVHRLVLEAFVGPCPEGMETRHLNDDRHDNRLVNLRWGTRLENAADARLNGIRRTGVRNGRARLTPEQVAEIRDLRGMVPQSKLGERYGVGQTTISAIQRGKLWADES